MTELSYNFNIFRFNDEFINLSEEVELPYYETKISVRETFNQNDIKYYNIDYEFNFIKSDSLSNEINEQIKITAHPFISNYFLKDTYNTIVKKNSLTTQLVNYLLMEYKDLQIEAGITTAQRYKNNIIYSLALLNLSNCNNSKLSNCRFNIIIKDEINEYNDKIEEFYDVSYKFNNKINKNDHPFKKYKKLIDVNDGGVIVKKNSLTTEFIKYLNMDYFDLEKESDTISSEEYKTILMISLCLFWD